MSVTGVSDDVVKNQSFESGKVCRNLKKSSASEYLDIQSDWRYGIRIWILFLIFSNALMCDLYVFCYPNHRRRVRPLASPAVTETGADRPCHLGESPTGCGRCWSNKAGHRSAIPKEGAGAFWCDMSPPRPARLNTFAPPLPAKTCEEFNAGEAQPSPLRDPAQIFALAALLRPSSRFLWCRRFAPRLMGIENSCLSLISPLSLSLLVYQFSCCTVSTSDIAFLPFVVTVTPCGAGPRPSFFFFFFIASFVMTSSCRIFHCEEK